MSLMKMPMKEEKKVLKNYIDVYVCIDMVCGDTNGEFGSGK